MREGEGIEGGLYMMNAVILTLPQGTSEPSTNTPKYLLTNYAGRRACECTPRDGQYRLELLSPQLPNCNNSRNDGKWLATAPIPKAHRHPQYPSLAIKVRRVLRSFRDVVPNRSEKPKVPHKNNTRYQDINS